MQGSIPSSSINPFTPFTVQSSLWTTVNPLVSYSIYHTFRSKSSPTHIWDWSMIDLPNNDANSFITQQNPSPTDWSPSNLVGASHRHRKRSAILHGVARPTSFGSSADFLTTTFSFSPWIGPTMDQPPLLKIGLGKTRSSLRPAGTPGNSSLRAPDSRPGANQREQGEGEEGLPDVSGVWKVVSGRVVWLHGVGHFCQAWKCWFAVKLAAFVRHFIYHNFSKMILRGPESTWLSDVSHHFLFSQPRMNPNEIDTGVVFNHHFFCWARRWCGASYPAWPTWQKGARAVMQSNLWRHVAVLSREPAPFHPKQLDLCFVFLTSL